jgi:hypothetical protein
MEHVCAVYLLSNRLVPMASTLCDVRTECKTRVECGDASYRERTVHSSDQSVRAMRKRLT